MSGTAARGSECVLDLETEVKIERDRSAFQIRHVNLGCILLLVDSPYLAPLWAARASAAAARGTMRRSISGLVLLLLGLEWSAAVGDTGRKLLASGLLRGKSVGDDGGGVGGVADSTRHRSDTSDGLPPPHTIVGDPPQIQVVSGGRCNRRYRATNFRMEPRADRSRGGHSSSAVRRRPEV